MNFDELEEKIKKNADILANVINESEGSPGKLDYSEESISVLEKYIEIVIDKGMLAKQNPELMNKYVNLAGSYLGEVIRKNLGGRYEIPNDGIFKGSVVLADIGNVEMISPFGKVRKRFKNGKEDDIEFYYKVIKNRR